MPTTPLSRRATLAGLGAGLGGLLAPGIVRAATDAGDPWTDLELLDAEDRAFRLGAGRAGSTLLALWASWCPLCLSELRALDAAAPVLHRRGINVLLVSSPLDWAADLDVATRHGTTLPRARPSRRNADSALRTALFSPDGWHYVPRSLLYNHARRRVVWSRLGRTDWLDAPWLGQAAAGA